MSGKETDKTVGSSDNSIPSDILDCFSEDIDQTNYTENLNELDELDIGWTVVDEISSTDNIRHTSNTQRFNESNAARKRETSHRKPVSRSKIGGNISSFSRSKSSSLSARLKPTGKPSFSRNRTAQETKTRNSSESKSRRNGKDTEINKTNDVLRHGEKSLDRTTKSRNSSESKFRRSGQDTEINKTNEISRHGEKSPDRRTKSRNSSKSKSRRSGQDTEINKTNEISRHGEKSLERRTKSRNSSESKFRRSGQDTEIDKTNEISRHGEKSLDRRTKSRNSSESKFRRSGHNTEINKANNISRHGEQSLDRRTDSRSRTNESNRLIERRDDRLRLSRGTSETSKIPTSHQISERTYEFSRSRQEQREDERNSIEAFIESERAHVDRSERQTKTSRSESKDYLKTDNGTPRNLISIENWKNIGDFGWSLDFDSGDMIMIDMSAKERDYLWNNIQEAYDTYERILQKWNSRQFVMNRENYKGKLDDIKFYSDKIEAQILRMKEVKPKAMNFKRNCTRTIPAERKAHFVSSYSHAFSKIVDFFNRLNYEKQKLYDDGHITDKDFTIEMKSKTIKSSNASIYEKIGFVVADLCHLWETIKDLKDMRKEKFDEGSAPLCAHALSPALITIQKNVKHLLKLRKMVSNFSDILRKGNFEFDGKQIISVNQLMENCKVVIFQFNSLVEDMRLPNIKVNVVHFPGDWLEEDIFWGKALQLFNDIHLLKEDFEYFLCTNQKGSLSNSSAFNSFFERAHSLNYKFDKLEEIAVFQGFYKCPTNEKLDISLFRRHVIELSKLLYQKSSNFVMNEYLRDLNITTPQDILPYTDVTITHDKLLTIYWDILDFTEIKMNDLAAHCTPEQHQSLQSRKGQIYRFITLIKSFLNKTKFKNLKEIMEIKEYLKRAKGRRLKFSADYVSMVKCIIKKFNELLDCCNVSELSLPISIVSELELEMREETQRNNFNLSSVYTQERNDAKFDGKKSADISFEELTEDEISYWERMFDLKNQIKVVRDKLLRTVHLARRDMKAFKKILNEGLQKWKTLIRLKELLYEIDTLANSQENKQYEATYPKVVYWLKKKPSVLSFTQIPNTRMFSSSIVKFITIFDTLMTDAGRSWFKFQKSDSEYNEWKRRLLIGREQPKKNSLSGLLWKSKIKEYGNDKVEIIDDETTYIDRDTGFQNKMHPSYSASSRVRRLHTNSFAESSNSDFNDSSKWSQTISNSSILESSDVFAVPATPPYRKRKEIQDTTQDLMVPALKRSKPEFNFLADPYIHTRRNESTVDGSSSSFSKQPQSQQLLPQNTNTGSSYNNYTNVDTFLNTTFQNSVNNFSGRNEQNFNYSSDRRAQNVDSFSFEKQHSPMQNSHSNLQKTVPVNTVLNKPKIMNTSPLKQEKPLYYSKMNSDVSGTPHDSFSQPPPNMARTDFHASVPNPNSGYQAPPKQYMAYQTSHNYTTTEYPNYCNNQNAWGQQYNAESGNTTYTRPYSNNSTNSYGNQNYNTYMPYFQSQ